MTRRVTTRANARVGLLGNPSDLYEGFGVGFAVQELGVVVDLRAARSIQLEDPLLRAAFELWSREFGVDHDTRPFELSFESCIPFQAGLSGSSAIIIAAVRAFSRWFERPIEVRELARIAWRVEAERLGIRAGALDRLVQAFGGLVAMDFADPFSPGAVERLDPKSLPPLLIAWEAAPGASSGAVHEPVWQRWRAGDKEVVRIAAALANGARAGKDALIRGDKLAVLAAINTNFDLRAELFPIAESDRSMINLGRSLGAATKFCGSGGSVLVADLDAARLIETERAYEAAGYKTLRPTVEGPFHD